MTKNDYELVAQAIHRALSADLSLIDVLCEEFRLQNPRFSTDKFVKACIPEGFGTDPHVYTSEWKHLLVGASLRIRDKASREIFLRDVGEVEHRSYSGDLPIRVVPPMSPGVDWPSTAVYEWAVIASAEVAPVTFSRSIKGLEEGDEVLLLLSDGSEIVRTVYLLDPHDSKLPLAYETPEDSDYVWAGVEVMWKLHRPR